MENGRTENFETWIKAQTDPAKLLVIDDDENDLELFNKYSAPFHCQMTSVNKGEIGLELVKTNRFRMVFVDWKLNCDLQGLDLFRALKNSTKIIRDSVPIVILSGYIDSKMAIDLSQIGFSVLIQKPECFNEQFFKEMFLLFNIPKIR